MRFKIRFNLGRGERYMTWKITNLNGDVSYLQPSEVTLRMGNCTLKNNKNSASKIFNGSNKTVCAWILCDRLEILPHNDNVEALGNKITYNPRVLPHWHDTLNNDIDNQDFPELITNFKSIHLVDSF